MNILKISSLVSFSILLTILSCGVKKDKISKVEPEILWNEMESQIDTTYIDYTKRKVFHGSETVFTDLIHTKLEVSFDWTKSHLLGKATITAKPHFYASDSLILDAKGMEIKSVMINSQKLIYSYDSSFLRIRLDKIYTRNDKYTIQIDYIAKPDERETGGSAAITSDKGLYFINPKGEDKNVMPQIWTQGETESSSVWFPTIDAPNVKTTEEILITVDKKYLTLSNGKLIKSTENSDGTRTDHWKQDLPHAPYLFMMGVGEFKKVKDVYTRNDGSKMDVDYLVEPEWEQYAKAIFGETPAMIKFFSELTGVEYPWDKYSQIVVRDYVSGAMENTGAVVFGDYAYKTDRELLDDNDNSTIAHELFHHWFGDLVTAESWSNLPLNESFANYSQYLWDEHRYGLDEADYQAENEKLGYFSAYSSGTSHDLIWNDYADKEQMFDGHSYNKGGRILHMLRNVIGDEAFFAGLKLYLKTNQFKAAEFHNLRLAFEEVSGQDLNWFFKQWFEASGHPDLDVIFTNNMENHSVALTVYQNQELSKTPLYLLPVSVMVYDDAGEHLHRIKIDLLENEFSFPVSGNLKNIIFDYEQNILGKVIETKDEQFYIHQYYNGKRFLARWSALEKAAKIKSAEGQKVIMDALSDKFWVIRKEAIKNIEYLEESNKKLALEKLQKMILTDENSKVRAEGIKYLSGKISVVDFEDLSLKVLKTDKSYLVVGNALIEISRKNEKLAREEAGKLEKENSSYIKSSIAQIYATSGDAKQIPFYESVLSDKKVGGYDAIVCLNTFSYFMSRQAVETQAKALNIYKSTYENGGAYTKMFMPQNVDFLLQSIVEKTNENNSKIELLEKEKNFVEANLLRKTVKEQEAVVQGLKTYLIEVELMNER